MVRIEKVSDLNRLDEIEVLEKLCFSDPYSIQMLKEDMSNDHARYWILEIDKKAVGYLSAWDVLGEIDLNRICIIEGFRNKGAAGQLIDELIKYAKGQKANKIMLEVKESNLAAIKLYKKFDFEIIAERKAYYRDGSAAYVMERKIDEF